MSGSKRSIVVVDAPSKLGLRPPRVGKEPGVGKLAAALRSRGIISRLQALDGGRVAPPPYSPDIDLETTVINGEALGEFADEFTSAIVAAFMGEERGV